MRAYRVCKFSTLINEMAVEKATIISLLYEIVLSESLKVLNTKIGQNKLSQRDN